MNGVILFNPRSAWSKARIPNSVLQVAASIEGQREWVIVDGNRESDSWSKIKSLIETSKYGYFCVTVMPGPSLREAIPFTREVRNLFPNLVIIWGGYFASNQYKVALTSGCVDYVVNGPGDHAFPQLLHAIETGADKRSIKNLIFLENGVPVKTPKADLFDMDALPRFPYEKLHEMYPFKAYLGKSFLGTKTISYHSSFGCPFTCSFCAVVPIYEARWKGKSAEGIYADIKFLKETYGGNAIEFMDNNFFVSEKRSVAFSNLMLNEGIAWWGEGRIDTLDKYSDESLALMHRAGCKMIFFGAESGSDEVLAKMDKGGKQSRAQIKSFAERLGRIGIIPEYSFVLGTPAETPEKVMAQIDAEIAFIREIKSVNPKTEIIIYVYSPVPTEGSERIHSRPGSPRRW
jgi:anaerobic magnesium-protoporphyrin IX monomethyl ester cyclase